MSQTEVQLIKDAVIVNADINASAAIALSKIATGALPSGITVASANLVDGTIVNADINASAAIDVSKISGAMPTTGGTFSSSVTFTGDVHFDGETAGRDIDFDRSDNALEFADNAKLILGSGADCQLLHDGTDTFIQNKVGDLKIANNVAGDVGGDITIQAMNSENSIKCIHDGAVELYFNGTKKFETTNDGISVGSVTMDSTFNNIGLPDAGQVRLGNGEDLRIYHSSGVNYIDANAGNLAIRGTGNDNILFYTANGDVEIYHDGSKKFETQSTGVTITGVCTATSFSGSGANLTDVDAGATGGGSDKIFYENGQTVTTNYTIGDTFGAACNAMAAGPITINSGVTVTVNSGETLTIV